MRQGVEQARQPAQAQALPRERAPPHHCVEAQPLQEARHQEGHPPPHRIVVVVRREVGVAVGLDRRQVVRHLLPFLLHGHVLRRVALEVGEAEVDVEFGEDLGGLEVALHGRPVQGSAAVLVNGVLLALFLVEQVGGALEGAVVRRPVQRRVLLEVARVHVGAKAEEVVQHQHVAALCRVVHRLQAHGVLWRQPRRQALRVLLVAVVARRSRRGGRGPEAARQQLLLEHAVDEVVVVRVCRR
mmetsp:Transcript_7990/g.33631  ORF Transcript_7990/g.33631 Transcript_7990/m.33631 type:complete len:242 (-) Transcript_7990:495-1220(-)